MKQIFFLRVCQKKNTICHLKQHKLLMGDNSFFVKRDNSICNIYQFLKMYIHYIWGFVNFRSTSPKKSSSPSHKYRQPSSHHHSNRKTVSPTENGWCSNKFIQIVIITLILIMAFWWVVIVINIYIFFRLGENVQHTH